MGTVGSSYSSKHREQVMLSVGLVWF